MKVCVVVPHEAYLAQAGVRIRYERIAPHLRSLGHSMDMATPADVSAVSHDVYLFSKVYDARSYLLASRVKRDGKKVGVDLFDDYFSQVHDSRLVPQRRWLRTIATWCDFVLCSTPRMAQVAAEAVPDVPSHVLNDPCDGLDGEAMARLLDEKARRACSTSRIDVAWFGTGDNGHFQVGLSDLHAYSAELGELARTGFDVRLRILTNPRAMTAGKLEAVQRLPVPWELAEWSVEAEEQLLRESLVAFLPVNAQAFSIAKSLNRAVTALSRGTQVLSAGHPLYEPLAQWVYRSPRELATDLREARLRLRPQTVPALADAFASVADAAHEAARFATFLEGLRARAESAVGEVAVVHGVRSLAEVHKFAGQARAPSAGSPFSSGKLSYDVEIARSRDDILLVIADALVARIEPGLRAAVARREFRGRDRAALSCTRHFPRLAALLREGLDAKSSPLLTAACYAPVMSAWMETLRRIFPDFRFALSEAEPPHDAVQAMEAG